MTNEELRKEFREHFTLDFPKTGGIYIQDGGIVNMEYLEEWWLSKVATAREEGRKEVLDKLFTLIPLNPKS